MNISSFTRQLHYSGEVENVYLTSQHIYSENGVSNFIRYHLAHW